MPFINDSFFSSKLEVRKKGVQKGVFAKSSIRKGEILSIAGGRILPRRTVARLPQNLQKLCYYVENNFYLCPFSSRKISPDLYMNHSCDPNAGGEENALTTVAARNIKKGEEVKNDYEKDFGRGLKGHSPLEHFRCNCDSKKCRGIIRF